LILTCGMQTFYHHNYTLLAEQMSIIFLLMILQGEWTRAVCGWKRQLQLRHCTMVRELIVLKLWLQTFALPNSILIASSKIIFIPIHSQTVLTATSEQGPPSNNGQPKAGQIKFNSNFDWKPSKERPPMYNGHYFGVLRKAVVDRFDCISISISYRANVMNFFLKIHFL
jgi:hypothetical protein